MHSTLFFPSIRRGNGTGHLIRCCRAAEALDPGAAILLYDTGESIDVESVISLFPSINYVRDFSPAGMVLFDQRTTPNELSDAIDADSCVVVLDEAGGLRRTADFVIDMLIGGKYSRSANIRISPTLPRNRREASPQNPGRVLVTFGGEDPAGLTTLTLDALSTCEVFADSYVAVARGPSFGDEISRDAAARITLIDPDPLLRERFFEFDIVITSYGLTALEARSAGCAVGIVDPSRYHRRLSKREGYFHLGIRKVSIPRLERLGRAPKLGLDNSPAPIAQGKSLDENLRALRFVQRNRCPVCGRTTNRSRARFPTATFFRCGCTGLLYRVGFEAPEKYGADYFFDSYRRQYGKTYLEDFEAIKATGLRRLELIEMLLTKGKTVPVEGATLLDVGCAFGPFLSAAAERGFRPFGIDVSVQAIDYVRSELGLEAVDSDVFEFAPENHGVGAFDVVSLWYVIEHFENLGDLLLRITDWIRPGGVFAFSTPNLGGISGISKRRRFLSESPKDHYVIFSFRSVRRVLARFGFIVVRSRSTGHHPERFPLVGRFPRLHPLIRLISRIARLGDTFEVYALRSTNKVG